MDILLISHIHLDIFLQAYYYFSVTSLHNWCIKKEYVYATYIQSVPENVPIQFKRCMTS